MHSGLKIYLIAVIRDANNLSLLRSRDEVHGAAHSLDKFAGNHEVGEVTSGGNLHGTQDRNVHVTSTDHSEGLGRVENGSTRDKGDGLLAGVDDVGVELLLGGVTAHSEDTVLGLEPDVDALGDVVGSENGDTDTKVAVVAVLELLGRTLGDTDTVLLRLALGGVVLGLGGGLGGLSQGDELNLLLLSSGDDAVDVDTGEVNVHGVDLADLDNVLSLDERVLGSLGDEGTEGAGGVTEDTVSSLVDLPGAEDGDVTVNGGLEDVALAVELADLLLVAGNLDDLLALGVGLRPLDGDVTGLDGSAGTSAGVETGHTGTSGTETLSDSALGSELEGDVAGNVGVLESLVGANVGEDHLLDLAREDEGRETTGTDVTGVVRNNGEALDVGAVDDGLDERLGGTAETETSREDELVASDDILDGLSGVGPDLVDGRVGADVGAGGKGSRVKSRVGDGGSRNDVGAGSESKGSAGDRVAGDRNAGNLGAGEGASRGARGSSSKGEHGEEVERGGDGG